MPEYLHANYSKIAYYFKNSEIRSRDEMINQLQKFSEGKNIKFYDEKERDEFIEKIVDVPDDKVLERYVKLLESCL